MQTSHLSISLDALQPLRAPLERRPPDCPPAERKGRTEEPNGSCGRKAERPCLVQSLTAKEKWQGKGVCVCVCVCEREREGGREAIYSYKKLFFRVWSSSCSCLSICLSLSFSVCVLYPARSSWQTGSITQHE